MSPGPVRGKYAAQGVCRYSFSKLSCDITSKFFAVAAEEEVDGELLGWLWEAWDFCETKGRGSR